MLHQARAVDRLLPYLLAATRDLESAKSELRWLRQAFPNSPTQLLRACLQRSRHYPLQYILGSQPFERLDVLCEPGVLIPRWETEEWASKLAARIKGKRDLKIADLCTGTGCIPLLLATAVANSCLWGVDISDTAVELFNRNCLHNASLIPKDNEITALKSNVLSHTLPLPSVDLITANPPYIPSLYNPASLVDRSVRLYEPKLALIGDNEFYTAIFNHAINLQAKALVCEVGEQYQIDHVIDLAKQHNMSSTLLWSYGQMNDASGNPRIVVLWKPAWSFLSGLCSKI